MRNRNLAGHRTARTLDKRSRGTVPARRNGEVQEDFVRQLGREDRDLVAPAKVPSELGRCREGVAPGALQAAVVEVLNALLHCSAMSAPFAQAFELAVPFALALELAAAIGQAREQMAEGASESAVAA
jgi:hypothetical protein